MTRRERILNFIKSYRSKEGFSPTYDEIAVACEVASKSNVGYHVRELEREGFITHRPNVPRSIVVVDWNAYKVEEKWPSNRS